MMMMMMMMMTGILSSGSVINWLIRCNTVNIKVIV